jgi:hypothetical protein
MRAIFTVVGLLAALLVVALLVKKQLAPVTATEVVQTRPAASGAAPLAGAPQQQLQQFQQNLDAAMKQPARDVPDDQ